MKLEPKHAEIIMKLSMENVEEAMEITDGEILETVEKSADINEFKQMFQELLDSKKVS